MLLFVRFLATGQSFSFDVRPQGPVQQLVDLLTAQLPRYIVRRLLFAGRVLQWDRTIGRVWCFSSINCSICLA